VQQQKKKKEKDELKEAMMYSTTSVLALLRFNEWVMRYNDLGEKRAKHRRIKLRKGFNA
jgi:hypothetical protein